MRTKHQILILVLIFVAASLIFWLLPTGKKEQPVEPSKIETPAQDKIEIPKIKRPKREIEELLKDVQIDFSKGATTPAESKRVATSESIKPIESSKARSNKENLMKPPGAQGLPPAKPNKSKASTKIPPKQDEKSPAKGNP